ncbi:MAG: 2-desacetyl-2-hydroxyethyl bacteriochlorophyllide A dehydrogenase [Verrucomicrobiales bacterium]|jgi:2-desacetyl-2-hydroxyethyl bacteriochlorophyllide A dehydrogenase
MKHVVLAEPGRFEFGESPDPQPQPGDAIVRVDRIGVCGTDIHAFYGRQPFFDYPRILGHELGVEIVAAPPNSGLKPGDRCAVEPYLNNPDSQASRRGKTNCCEELQVLGIHTDGGMRSHIAVPAAKLHKSDSMTLDQLALVETLCIGAHASARSRTRADDFVCVIGAGPIGLSVLEFVKERTDRPIAVLDVNDARLAFVREQLGIEHTINLTKTENLADDLRAAAGGDLPTVLFDATGNPKSMMGTFDLVANGSTIVFVGLFQGDASFHDPTFHRKEISLMATRNGTSADFRTVMDAIEQSKIDTTPWLTHRLGFEEIPAKFEAMTKEPSLVKAIIEMPGA